jgi:hypothetical protein
MWNSSDEAGMSSPSSTPSGAEGSFWRSPALWLAMVLLIVAATYLQAPRIGFIWDDHLLIEGQASRPLSDVISTPYWRRADLGLATGAYHRPVTELTWALDRAVYGAGPAGFHVTNVLIHLIVCALLFFLCRAAGAPPPHAAFAAAIFGVTPRLLESIGCASGRTDPLATLACLAALLAWGRGGAPPARRALAALLLFAGLLAKEVAIAGVLAIAALELARVRRGETTPRDALQDITPVAVAMMLWLALRSAALTGAAVASTGFSIGDRVLFVPQALGRYVLMLLSPFEPTLRIGRLGVIDGFEVAIGAATIAGVAALAVRAWRDRWSPPLIAAATLGGLSIAPVLHFFAPLQEVVASDRYLYLPLAALLWALTPGIARALDSGRPAHLRGALAFAAAGLVLALAGATSHPSGRRRPATHIRWIRCPTRHSADWRASGDSPRRRSCTSSARRRSTLPTRSASASRRAIRSATGRWRWRSPSWGAATRRSPRSAGGCGITAACRSCSAISAWSVPGGWSSRPPRRRSRRPSACIRASTRAAACSRGSARRRRSGARSRSRAPTSRSESARCAHASSPRSVRWRALLRSSPRWRARPPQARKTYVSPPSSSSIAARSRRRMRR